MLGIIAILAILIIAIEKKSSIKILLRLFLTAILSYFIYIKAIINGQNIILFTVIVTFLIVTLNILIKDGIHRRAISEIISVLIISMLCSILVFIVCLQTEIIVIDEKSYTNLTDVNLDKSIVFGVVALVFLGIYMDIVSKIILRLDEEKDRAQDITWKDQFKTGIDIGKELIIENINMIFLVFAGSTILSVCLYLKNGYTVNQLLDLDSFFLSIVIMLFGSICLILAVPITSFIYAMFNRKKTIYKTVSDNKIDGKRSLKL